jgi:hypothetical protein
LLKTFSDFMTVMAVYTGSAVNGLTKVTTNELDDPSRFELLNDISFAVRAGTTYRIVVAGAAAEFGSATIHFDYTPSEPSFSDITTPADTVLTVNGSNDGDADAGPPPTNETVDHAFDNQTDKYLNFLDLNSGLVITPNAGATVVHGLRLYTANDAPET